MGSLSGLSLSSRKPAGKGTATTPFVIEDDEMMTPIKSNASSLTPSQGHIVSNTNTPIVQRKGSPLGQLSRSNMAASAFIAEEVLSARKSPAVVTPSSRDSKLKKQNEGSHEIVSIPSGGEISSDLNSLLKYQKMLEMNPDFNLESQHPTKQLFSDYFKQKFSTMREIEDRHKSHFIDDKVGDRIKKKIERDRIDELIAPRKAPISDEDDAKIRRVLAGPSSHDVLIDKFNIDITRDKIHCLRQRTWLNDEVVNFYMAMLLDRDSRLVAESKTKVEQQQQQKGKSEVVVRRPSYFFNSFFVSKLLEGGRYDYSKVKRWTKKFDVFEQEKIFFPVNLSNTHWTMAVIFVQKKEIHYYDSMSGSGQRQLNALLDWIVDEAREKKSLTLDRNEWKLFGGHQLPTPQQENGYDCGMFSICCADYLSDDLPLEYDQSEIPQMRYKVGAAILNGTLPY